MAEPDQRHTFPRKRLASAAACGLLLTVFPLSSSAWAETQGDIYADLNNTHSAHWAWYAPGDNEMIKLSIGSGGMGQQRCVDTWFDWEPSGTPQPHYDARVTRTCKDNSWRAANNFEWWLEPDGTGRNLIDAHKMFVCLYNEETNKVMLQESNIIRGGDPGLEAVNPNYTQSNPNNVTRAWHRQADGDTYISDGGFPARSDQ